MITLFEDFEREIFFSNLLPLIIFFLNFSFLFGKYFSYCSFSDSTLANILSPLPDACGTKFELKVDEVLFVGHPKLAYKKQDQELKVSVTTNGLAVQREVIFYWRCLMDLSNNAYQICWNTSPQFLPLQSQLLN